MNRLPELSIIIVNYNGDDHVLNCIQSIYDHVSAANEIIVVDNNSHDDSVQRIVSNYPDVKMIRNSENLGFAAGNNIGAKTAKSPVLLLLNNDARILSDVKPALEHLKNNKTTGVIGGRIEYADGRLQFSIVNRRTPIIIMLSWLNVKPLSHFITGFKRFNDDPSYYEKSHIDIYGVSGAFIFIKNELWKNLNGLNEDYFMYVEDVDFCRSTKLAGYRTDYLPEVRALHLEGGGKEWIGRQALLDTIHSSIIYLKKFHPKYPESIFRSGLAVVMFVRSFSFLVLSLIKKRKINRDISTAFFYAGLQCFKKITLGKKINLR